MVGPSLLSIVTSELPLDLVGGEDRKMKDEGCSSGGGGADDCGGDCGEWAVVLDFCPALVLS